MKRNFCLAAFALVLGFYTLNNISFFIGRDFAFIFDENGHIMTALHYNYLLFSPDHFWWEKAGDIFCLSSFQGHPPLLNMVGAFVFQLLKICASADVRWMIVGVNLLFLAIAAVSVYGIGKILYSRAAGVMAVFLLFMFPFVTAHTRAFMLDFPLMAMVALSVLMLFRTHHFLSLRYSLACGACVALATLIKETAIVFLLPPVIAYAIQSWHQTDRKQRFVNAGFALGLAVLLVGVVFFRPESFYVFSHYFKMAQAKDHPSFLYYILNVENYVGLWLWWVGLPLLVLAGWRFRWPVSVLWCWLVIPLLFFSMPSSKWPRYILPILPALALLMAGALMVRWRQVVLWRAVVLLVVVIALGQYVAYSCGFLKYTKKIKVASFGYEVGRLTYMDNPGVRTGQRLLDTLRNEKVPASSKKLVLALFNMPEIYGTARIGVALLGLPYSIVCATEIFTEALPRWPWKGMPEEVLKADYIWLKTGMTPRAFTQKLQDIEEGLRQGFMMYQDHFLKIAEIPAPDGTVVEVYQRVR